MRLKKTGVFSRRIVMGTAIALVLAALITRPAVAYPSGSIVSNPDGTLTVTYAGFDPSLDNAILFFCPTSESIATCDEETASYAVGDFGGLEPLGPSPATVAVGMSVNDISDHLAPSWSAVALPAGNYTVVLADDFFGFIIPIQGLTPARIGTTDDPSSDVSGSRASAGSSVQTLSLFEAEGVTCSSATVSGQLGQWIALPAADYCTSVDQPDGNVLGWSTVENFPVEIARRQVTNGWGAYEVFGDNGRLTGVFIPAGGATVLTGSTRLFPIFG